MGLHKARTWQAKRGTLLGKGLNLSFSSGKFKSENEFDILRSVSHEHCFPEEDETIINIRKKNEEFNKLHL